jgi:site-specific DNA-methyltransferase (adenine-specific)
MLEVNKIYNQDCIEGMQDIDEAQIDLCITSPPYNVGIEYDTWNDFMEYPEYKNFMYKWLSGVYRILKDDGRIALNIPYEVNMMQRGGRILLVSEYWQTMKEIGYQFAGILKITIIKRMNKVIIA